MKAFHLPDLGEGLADAEIVQWHVSPGNLVNAGDALVSVETAKAIVEIPSPVSGRIARTCGATGDVMPVGSLLAEFEENASGIEPPEKDSGTVVGVIGGDAREVHETTLLIGRHRSPEQRMTGARTSGRQMPRDRIKRENVSLPCETDQEPVHGARRHMAQTMARAHEEVALVTIFDEANLRRWKKDSRPLERLLRALVRACRQEPTLNAHWQQEPPARLLHRTINAGIAVDTPEGLLVPVLQDAASLVEDTGLLSERLKQLLHDARTRALAPDQLRGATITLSSFGMLGGRFATPMVVPPQVAILGAGAIHELPLVRGKQLENAPHLPLSLSFDHRAVTGGEAARFLRAVIEDLQKKH